jgi:hypothetical protein
MITAYIKPALNDSVPEPGSRGDLTNHKDPGTPQMLTVPCPDAPSPWTGCKPLCTIWSKHVMICPVSFQSIGDWNWMPWASQLCGMWERIQRRRTFPRWKHRTVPSKPILSYPGSTTSFRSMAKKLGANCSISLLKTNNGVGGELNTENVNQLLSQVTLMQSILVQWITKQEAQTLAPDLWTDTTSPSSTTRYHLASYDDEIYLSTSYHFIWQTRTNKECCGRNTVGLSI